MNHKSDNTSFIYKKMHHNEIGNPSWYSECYGLWDDYKTSNKNFTSTLEHKRKRFYNREETPFKIHKAQSIWPILSMYVKKGKINKLNYSISSQLHSFNLYINEHSVLIQISNYNSKCAYLVMLLYPALCSCDLDLDTMTLTYYIT